MASFDMNKFMELYSVCFDEAGHVKACGRDNCRNLIKFLDDPKYGDLSSGRMNIDAIVGFKNKLVSEGEAK